MCCRYNLRARHQCRALIKQFSESCILEVFSNEIPDPSCELFPQSHLTIFHRFCALPTELRLRIWALCLPRPRRVKLSYQVGKPSRGPQLSKLLRICSESRLEVLHNYTVFFQNSYGNRSAPTKPAPIFFSAKRDELLLDFGHRNRYSIFSFGMNQMFKDMVKQNPSVFENVKRIELHDFIWSAVMKPFFFFEGVGVPRPSVLEHFGNLEGVVCVRDDSISGWHGALVEGLREDVQRVFRLLGGTVPWVEVKTSCEVGVLALRG